MTGPEKPHLKLGSPISGRNNSELDPQRELFKLQGKQHMLRQDITRSRRSVRRLQILVSAGIVGYTTIMALTDHILPTNNIPLDALKYGVDLFLTSVLLSTMFARVKARRKTLKDTKDAYTTAQLQEMMWWRHRNSLH